MFFRRKIVTDGAWMESMAVDFHFYHLLEKHIPACNQKLEELAFPEVEEPDSWLIEDVVDELRFAFNDDTLKHATRHLHHNDHPLAQLYNNEEAMTLLKDHLQQHLWDARWKIKRGWKKARVKLFFSEGVDRFWDYLRDNSQDQRTSSKLLKQYLTQCLSQVMEEERYNPSHNHSLSLRSISTEKPYYGEEKHYDPVGWQIMEAGVLAGFSYYLLDSADTSAAKFRTLPLSHHPSDETLDAIDAIDWDAIGIVSFPLIGSIRQAHKQLGKVIEDQISVREAGINFSITISSKLAGATLGGWIGKSLGTTLYPGGGTIAGGIIGGGLGSVLGGRLARTIMEHRYQKEMDRYYEIKQNMENKIDRQTRRYAAHVQKLALRAQESLEKDHPKLRLKMPDSEALEKLRGDILRALKAEDKAMNYKYTGLIRELSLASLSQVGTIMLKYRMLPMRRKGRIYRNRKQWQKRLRNWNGQVSIGLIGWVYLLQGVFDHQMYKIFDAITSSEERIHRTHEHGVIKLHNQRERILERYAQFS